MFVVEKKKKIDWEFLLFNTNFLYQCFAKLYSPQMLLRFSVKISTNTKVPHSKI